LGYSFKVGGSGVTFPNVTHDVPLLGINPATGLPQAMFGLEGKLLNSRSTNSLNNKDEVAFAVVLPDGAPTGALVAIMEFSGNPENIRFSAYEGTVHDYPIGQVVIIR
jgi:ABC-type enterobactin transport system permease subunit